MEQRVCGCVFLSSHCLTLRMNSEPVKPGSSMGGQHVERNPVFIDREEGVWELKRMGNLTEDKTEEEYPLILCMNRCKP